MRILTLTPIQDEFNSLNGALEQLGLEPCELSAGRLSCKSYLDGDLVVAPGGLGKAQFGIQTQYAIDRLADLDLIVCAGTSGGLRPDLTIGDVVVATETVEHDFKWGMKAKPLPRFAGSLEAIESIKTSLPTTERTFDIHFGIVASGDEGIAAPRRVRELRRDTDAIAVAWEGAGGARAAMFSNLPFLEVRGISDGAGDDAPSEFETNLPHAMHNVAVIILSLAGPGASASLLKDQSAGAPQ